MESLVSTFHIDLSLFISQLINFAIVFSVLYFFAFKPLIKNMAERSEKIDESLKNAEDIEGKMISSKKEREEILLQARKDANSIIEDANNRGNEKSRQLVEKAKEEIGSLINSEKEKFSAYKAEVLREIKRESAELVALSVEKVLLKKNNAKKDADLIEDILS